MEVSIQIGILLWPWTDQLFVLFVVTLSLSFCINYFPLIFHNYWVIIPDRLNQIFFFSSKLKRAKQQNSQHKLLQERRKTIINLWLEWWNNFNKFCKNYRHVQQLWNTLFQESSHKKLPFLKFSRNKNADRLIWKKEEKKYNRLRIIQHVTLGLINPVTLKIDLKLLRKEKAI